MVFATYLHILVEWGQLLPTVLTSFRHYLHISGPDEGVFSRISIQTVKRCSIVSRPAHARLDKIAASYCKIFVSIHFSWASSITVYILYILRACICAIACLHAKCMYVCAWRCLCVCVHTCVFEAFDRRYMQVFQLNSHISQSFLISFIIRLVNTYAEKLIYTSQWK